jgi:hypothetical protein
MVTRGEKGIQDGKLNTPCPAARWRCRRRSRRPRLTPLAGGGDGGKRVGERFSCVRISVEARSNRSSEREGGERDFRFPRGNPWTTSNPCRPESFAARKRLYVWRGHAVQGQSFTRGLCSTSGTSSAAGVAGAADRRHRIGPSLLSAMPGSRDGASEPPTPSLGFVHRPATHHGTQHSRSEDFLGCRRGQVAVEDYEIRQHSRHQLAFFLFLKLCER